MTPGRHVTLPLVAVLLLFLLVFLGACIVLLRPGRERPSDAEPTAAPVTVLPSSPTVYPLPSPTPTVERPDPVLITPVVRPAPTRTPTPAPPTVTPRPPTPDRPPIQKGGLWSS